VEWVKADDRRQRGITSLQGEQLDKGHREAAKMIL